MIRFDAVTIRYPGAAADAVHRVSFETRPRAITAVTGPNGSGKSTLVRALLRRVSVADGQIRVGDSALHDLSRRVFAQRVAVVPQREDPTFPLSVRAYVALGRAPHLGTWAAPGAADRDAIDAAIERTGIQALTDRRTDAVSGGEWQRVRIARALAQTPSDAGALVLDEPTTFLDIGHEMAVFELLSTLAESGLSILVITHQLNLIARFADTMVLMHEGAIVAHGAPETVMQGRTLERVYDWPLIVTRDPAIGAPVLVPLRSSGGRGPRPSLDRGDP
jgi:iron complex transport system ATP-binding protein